MFNLTPIWTPEAADLIRDAWLCARDGTDRQPIRDAYRANRHGALIAELMNPMAKEQAR